MYINIYIYSMYMYMYVYVYMYMYICIYVWTSQPMGWFGCSFFFFQTFWRFEKGWLQWLLKTQVHRLWCGSRPLVSAVGNWQKCRRNSLRWWGAPSWDSDGSTLMFGSPKDTPAFNHQVLVWNRPVNGNPRWGKGRTAVHLCSQDQLWRWRRLPHCSSQWSPDADLRGAHVVSAFRNMTW